VEEFKLMKSAFIRNSYEASDQSFLGGTTSFEKIHLDGFAVVEGGDGPIIALILRDKSRKDEANIPDTSRFRIVSCDLSSIKYAWG